MRWFGFRGCTILAVAALIVIFGGPSESATLSTPAIIVAMSPGGRHGYYARALRWRRDHRSMRVSRPGPTQASFYWSATSSIGASTAAFGNFLVGGVGGTFKLNGLYVRAGRSGL